MTREWDLGKNDKDKDNIKDNNTKLRRDERLMDKRQRHRTPEKSPEPGNIDVFLCFVQHFFAILDFSMFCTVYWKFQPSSPIESFGDFIKKKTHFS